MELYINLNHGGPSPSIDAPISADYPPYNSAEIAARCKVQSEDLTQDPFIPSPPQNNHNEVDEESLDDPEGKDLPVESSAFDRVDFEYRLNEGDSIKLSSQTKIKPNLRTCSCAAGN